MGGGVRDPAWAYIESLPDQVAHAHRHGLTVVVPDPGHEHGRRLLRTLGVWMAEGRIERVKPGPGFARWLADWKALTDDGWDVTVLLDKDKKSVVAMAARIVRP